METGGPDSWILRGEGAGLLGKEGGNADLVRILGLFQAGGFALDSCVTGRRGLGPWTSESDSCCPAAFWRNVRKVQRRWS